MMPMPPAWLKEWADVMFKVAWGLMSLSGIVWVIIHGVDVLSGHKGEGGESKEGRDDG